MPLGRQVIRSIRQLISENSPYAKGLHVGMLEEGTLLNGMAIITVVQAMEKKMATDAETRVLHINSGLYLAGKG